MPKRTEGKRLTKAQPWRLFDQRGIPFEVGDVVKVFHFTGVRRKQHFMFKQVCGNHEINGHAYLKFSHLDLTDNYYVEPLNGRVLDDYEIVQSIDCKFQERDRLNPAGRAALKTGASE